MTHSSERPTRRGLAYLWSGGRDVSLLIAECGTEPVGGWEILLWVGVIIFQLQRSSKRKRKARVSLEVRKFKRQTPVETVFLCVAPDCPPRRREHVRYTTDTPRIYCCRKAGAAAGLIRGGVGSYRLSAANMGCGSSIQIMDANQQVR